ncbi:hypothetical protein FKM82_002684 [Ascaphus truei]
MRTQRKLDDRRRRQYVMMSRTRRGNTGICKVHQDQREGRTEPWGGSRMTLPHDRSDATTMKRRSALDDDDTDEDQRGTPGVGSIYWDF